MDKAGTAISNTPHLMMPSWWVRAFEVASLRESDDERAMEQALASGLAPALTPIELNALAMVLDGFRDQILQGRADSLSLLAEEHLKHVGTSARGRRFAFEKVIQMLSGMRLLHRAGGDDGQVEAIKFFRQEFWSREGENLLLTLVPEEHGPELLLGVTDPWLDLIRGRSGNPVFSGKCIDAGPLMLWRSVWLEMSGPEQLLYMRLERAVQWEFAWLQLDGIFGAPVESLFAGIPLSQLRGGGAEQIPLVRKLRLLSRVGRKLEAHGVVTDSPPGHYLALGSRLEKALCLVFQLTRERLLSFSPDQYFERTGAWYLNHRYRPWQKQLLTMLLGTGHGPAWEICTRMWDSIRSVKGPHMIPGLSFGPGEVVLPQVLFMELSLRTMEGHALPLPRDVVPATVRALLGQPDGAGAETVESRFEKFVAVLRDDSAFVRSVCEGRVLSVASPAGRRDARVRRYLESVFEEQPVVVTTPAKPSPRLIVPAVQEPVRAPEPVVSEQPVRKGALSGALAAKMLKTASEELQAMRDHHPERYEELKRVYLASLDAVGKRFHSDVQKHLAPKVFEDQLRQRLVKFMVENPSVWRTADAVSGSRGIGGRG